MYEVVEGIKLETRTCKKCTNTFKVMPSHPQIYCSEFCQQLATGSKPFGKSRDVKKGKRKRKLKHTVQESDYDNQTGSRGTKKINRDSHHNVGGDRRRKVHGRAK